MYTIISLESFVNVVNVDGGELFKTGDDILDLEEKGVIVPHYRCPTETMDTTKESEKQKSFIEEYYTDLGDPQGNLCIKVYLRETV